MDGRDLVRQDTDGKYKEKILNSRLLWAHGLHLLFFPVWPVCSIDVCLDRLPSIPQNLRAFGDC